MFEKLVGISFVSAAADIILSGSSFRKYVKTVTGAVFALILITGIFGLPSFSLELPSLEEQNTDIEKAKEEYENMLSESVVLSVEKEIKREFQEEGIEIKNIVIDFFPDYSVKKIDINIENSSLYKEKAIDILKRMGFTRGVTVWG